MLASRGCLSVYPNNLDFAGGLKRTSAKIKLESLPKPPMQAKSDDTINWTYVLSYCTMEQIK